MENQKFNFLDTSVGSITDSQRKKVFSLLEERGVSKEELESLLKVKVSDLSKASASILIGYLTGGIEKEEAVRKIQDSQGVPYESREVGHDFSDDGTGRTENPIQKPEPKNPMTVLPGSTLALARTAGIPEEMANLFFMNLNGTAYIKVAGLQYMAGKVGYRRIEIIDSFDEKKGWVAEAKIYPKVDNKTLEALSKLSPETQKMAYEDLSKPTNGIGTANKDNVQNPRMLPYLREMAQTRALGRALRSYTGYGSTTYEELPDSQIEVD